MSVTCSICDKVFANKYSLASHKSRYHNSKDEQADTDHPYPYKINANSSDSQRESGTEREATSSSSEEVPDSQNDALASKDSEDGKIRYRSSQNKAKRLKTYHALERNKTRKQLESMERNILDKLEKNKEIDVGKANNHQKLIMHLCRAVLDGSLPLSKPDIDFLKPHVSDVRKIAQGTQKVRKTLIDSHIDQHVQTGGSILNTILECALTVLPALFAL